MRIVQSVLADVGRYSLQEARALVKELGADPSDVDRGGGQYWRFRQFSPDDFARPSFRTVKTRVPGLVLVYGQMRREALARVEHIQELGAPRSHNPPAPHPRGRVRYFAKLTFTNGHDVEKMWVRDVAPAGGGLLVGRLDNEPLALTDLRYSQRVTFNPSDAIELVAVRRRP